MEEEEKKTPILKQALNTLDEMPYKNVRELFANIISHLINNSHISKEDKQFLKEFSKNSKFIEYVQFNSDDYKELYAQFQRYQKSIDTSSEAYEASYLLKDLKIIISKHEIMENAASFNKALKNVENRANKEATERIKKLDKTIEKKLAQSDEMLGDIAENSNAKKYFDYAEKNRKSAQWLFWFSVAIMGSLAIFSAFALYFTEITSRDLFVRISLFFAILLPAFFMMREAKKLKDKEFQYTDMAYRIVTSEPYIDGLNLSLEEKAKLKAALVKDFFGRPIECRDDGGLPPIDNICEIIRACIDSCRKS